MPAEKKLVAVHDRVGIIAGYGSLPREIVASLNKRNIKPFLISLSSITDKETEENVETLQARITAIGKIIGWFRANNVNQIVLAGGMRRPSFSSLLPDAMGFKLLNRIRKVEKAGDNSLLNVITGFLEEQGLIVIGIDEVAPELLAPKGVITSIQPTENELMDIEYGVSVALELGSADIGQAVIVQNGKTIGKETSEGTDALIKSCADTGGSILIKMKKPQQDRRIDLPSIGISTIERLYECGMKGVAIDSGNSLILERNQTIQKANELGIFIYGI